MRTSVKRQSEFHFAARSKRKRNLLMFSSRDGKSTGKKLFARVDGNFIIAKVDLCEMAALGRINAHCGNLIPEQSLAVKKYTNGLGVVNNYKSQHDIRAT
ncbi:CLUMA_CG001752, isoform A [Clunio marinus]|uniref:CLUMA_CG001728, isoform A n=1 Tax=Clunio marinus TaxID=568069 RepID=A0A1J1HN98_9DIPT|nr:CLUMA_CG001728, isoform A [Clunio marinus]CRK87966.1 CLUMA_CG001752, isoform A [Clunio marinus]